MKSTIKTKNRKYTNYYLEMIIEIIDRSSTTLATSIFDIVEKTILEESKQRRTRTMQQKKRATCRRDANEIVDN